MHLWIKRYGLSPAPTQESTGRAPVERAFSPSMVLLRIRISDSVLDPGDWPVARLRIGRNLRIRERHHERPGVYDFGHDAPQVGHSLDQLSEWLSREPHGPVTDHQYHEVKIDNRWRSFVTPHELVTHCRRRLGVGT